MKKHDLDTGMKVILSNGEEMLVLISATWSTATSDILVKADGTWLSLDQFYSNLTHAHNDEYDIVSVYMADGPYGILTCDKCGWTEVWSRRTKMTLAEIEDALGYKIELVGERK